MLPDPHVSRKHLTVRLADGQVAIEVCEGAKALLVNGAVAREARIAVGEGVVIGDTALVVAAEDDGGSPLSGASLAARRTDLRTLMTGVGADVRGLAIVMDLVDALDAAGSEAEAIEALREWAKEPLKTSAVTLDHVAEGAPTALATDGPMLLERGGDTPARTLLSLPALHEGPAWLTFVCEVPGDAVTATMRRLAAVAARIATATLTRLAAVRRAQEDAEAFRRASQGSARSFLGDSEASHEVARLVPRLAAVEALVLIEGETGVGKTFLARLIHEAGPRAKEPLRVINCAAIPETLIESELFGHERGAFSGATSARAGVLEAAGRGTVLLDELGELPLPSQAKLLRVLEEKRFERLGSNRSIELAARVIVATNRDLAAMAREGTFREDLYYRVAVVKLRVPPLRDRGEDLVLLAERILADLAAQSGRRVVGFSPQALDAIRRHAWPGNVRELRNAIERALVVGEGDRVDARHFPDTVRGAPPLRPSGLPPADDSFVRLPAKLDWLEERAIQAALKATSGNQTHAAALLGISRNTLRRKLPGGAAPGD